PGHLSACHPSRRRPELQSHSPPANSIQPGYWVKLGHRRHSAFVSTGCPLRPSHRARVHRVILVFTSLGPACAQAEFAHDNTMKPAPHVLHHAARPFPELAERLRRKSRKVTAPRQALLEILRRDSHPLSIREIFRAPPSGDCDL